MGWNWSVNNPTMAAYGLMNQYNAISIDDHSRCFGLQPLYIKVDSTIKGVASHLDELLLPEGHVILFLK